VIYKILIYYVVGKLVCY